MNTQFLIYSTKKSGGNLPSWHGTEFAKDFKSACDKLAMRNETFRKHYNADTLTYEGYPLYPSYKMATKNM